MQFGIPFASAGESFIDKFNKSVNETATNAGLATDEDETFEFIVGGFVNQILNVLGVVFLILVIYGGVSWMLAAGNESKIEKAKGIIIHSIIGLAIILLSKVIALVIIDLLLPASS